jgi:site-specific recombinase
VSDDASDQPTVVTGGAITGAVGTVRERVLAFFGPSSLTNPTRVALADHLQAFVSAESLGDRLDAWLQLVHWTRVGTSRSLQVLSARMQWREAYVYWDLLLDLLEQEPSVREDVQAAVNRVLLETEAVDLVGEAGLPSVRGFLTEVSLRVLNKVLPSIRNDRDLTHLLQRQYRSAIEVKWFSRIPPRLFTRVLQALTPPRSLEEPCPLMPAFANGFRLLAIRVQGQGLSHKLRVRSRRPSQVMESPFYRLAQLSEQIALWWQDGQDVTFSEVEWRQIVAECHNEIRWIRRQLEAAGVSVDIVYGLEVLQYCLIRMSAAMNIMTARDDAAYARAVHDFLKILIQASVNEGSVGHLVKTNTKMLHRKIVDRSGNTGEHYIAHDLQEYRHIWKAAAGGGVLTAFTAANKMAILGWGLAPFIEGFGYSLNYAVSFLLMQTFGLMLATKQPAMTAATLATIMRERPGPSRLDDIVEVITKISHSQIAATVSNVIVVALAAYVLDAGWRVVTGGPIIDAHAAGHVYDSLNPMHSGTVPFAVLTGVVLWLSSLAGGWIENWTVYHRLPQALAEHALGNRLLGADRLRRWTESLSRNIAGWGTNVSLGVMLGMTPAIGLFFGAPLDVRHVTLNSGTLGLAIASLQGDWYGDGRLLYALAGVGVMFVLNLGVSFALSLFTALRAYDFPKSDILELIRRLIKRFVDSPLDFVLPPRAAVPPSATEEKAEG